MRAGSLLGALCLGATVVCLPARASADVFANGSDISWVTQMEASGILFYNGAGTQQDCFQILNNLCVNSIRLRVWVNPAGGWCDTADMVAKAVRAQNMGQRVLVDIHYSDTWADPGDQNKPAAWANYTFQQLTAVVNTYTVSVMTALQTAGVTPTWVQVGNETNNGMLWPAAAGDPSGEVAINGVNNFTPFAELINAGYAGVKSVFPSAKVIIHISNGYDNALFEWMFDGLKAAGANWDVIGMSMYPSTYATTSTWQTYDTECLANMNDMVSRYGKQVMIVEAGMPENPPATSESFLADLITKTQSVTGGNGLGVFYWEPEAYNNWQGYSLVAFGANGEPTVAMNAFADNCVAAATGTPTGTPTVSPSVTATFSRTVTFTPSGSPTGTPSPSKTATRTATPSPTGTSSPSKTSTPTATSSFTGTASPSKTATQTVTTGLTTTVSFTATGTETQTSVPTAASSATTSASPTVQDTGSASPTMTSTLTPQASESDTPERTPTPIFSPSRTSAGSATDTPGQTETGTVLASGTFTPSATSSITATRTAGVTPGATATPSMTGSATGRPTGTSSDTPSSTTTATASPTAGWTSIPSFTATSAPSAAESFTETPGGGNLVIERIEPVPNPDPVDLYLYLAGPADRAVLSVYSTGMVLVGTIPSGPLGVGWNSVPVGNTLSPLPRGLYYVVAKAWRGDTQSAVVLSRVFKTRD